MFIRDYIPQDFDQVISLWKDTGIFAENRADTPESIEQCKAQGGRLLVLEDPRCGKIKGSVWLSWDGRRFFLHHLAVGPEVQRQGWGRKLSQAALDLARERGCPVKLEVHRDNKAALALYRSLGFTEFKDYSLFMHLEP